MGYSFSVMYREILVSFPNFPPEEAIIDRREFLLKQACYSGIFQQRINVQLRLQTNNLAKRSAFCQLPLNSDQTTRSVPLNAGRTIRGERKFIKRKPQKPPLASTNKNESAGHRENTAGV